MESRQASGLFDEKVFDDARKAIESAGQLMTTRELAASWNVTEQAFAERIKRGDFPAPVKEAGRVRLYFGGEVELYLAREGIRRYRTELLHKREQYRHLIEESEAEGADAGSIRIDLARLDYVISQMPQD